jgi:hypothetical protein
VMHTAKHTVISNITVAEWKASSHCVHLGEIHRFCLILHVPFLLIKLHSISLFGSENQLLYMCPAYKDAEELPTQWLCSMKTWWTRDGEGVP